MQSFSQRAVAWCKTAEDASPSSLRSGRLKALTSRRGRVFPPLSWDGIVKMPQSGRKSANKSGTTEALAFVSCLNGRDEGFFYTHICEEKNGCGRAADHEAAHYDRRSFCAFSNAKGMR